MPIHHQVWANILWNIKRALEKPKPETTEFFQSLFLLVKTDMPPPWCSFPSSEFSEDIILNVKMQAQDIIWKDLLNSKFPIFLQVRAGKTDVD